MASDVVTRRAEIAYIVLILVVAGIFWREASMLPPAPYDPLGPKSFPMGVSAVLATLGLAMLIRLLFGSSLGERAHAMETDGQHEQKPWVAAATLLLAMGYAAALSFRSMGFLPATAAYLFASGAMLGPFEGKRILGALAFAIAAAVILDLLFRVLFKLDLT